MTNSGWLSVPEFGHEYAEQGKARDRKLDAQKQKGTTSRKTVYHMVRAGRLLIKPFPGHGQCGIMFQTMQRQRIACQRIAMLGCCFPHPYRTCPVVSLGIAAIRR